MFLNQINKILKLPFRYKPWKPQHLKIILAELGGINKQPIQSDLVHLEATINWLCRAQDLRTNHPDAGGVSAGWSFEDGWLPSYPETSGYIVETFLAAEKILKRPELQERANKILDWELSIQNQDGSFPGHFGESGSKPVIFNTGQIMHGLTSGYQQLNRSECLESAVRAGHWMLQQQDQDGCWRRSTHNNTPHTYNTRAAWALLRTALAANDKQLEQSAINNINWALTQQTDSGWFKTNAFTLGKAPFTHTIAYAILGILESGLLLNDEGMIQAAIKAATAQAKQQRADGWLAGTYTDNWQPASQYCCLTGLAQFCIIWQRMINVCHQDDLTQATKKGLEYLKSNQRILGDNTPQDAGIAGSTPIWGRYSMFEYPNWAAKFFADALMYNMTNISIPNTK
ncbi:MAG: hypothetical protein GQ532_01160 [Methylomarinum sp.]|nr:hypothetical protein [Methylomarinum sp.]